MAVKEPAGRAGVIVGARSMLIRTGISRRKSGPGAKIVTDAAIDVRDKFVLALVPQHPKRQSCEVVWRRGRTYGVKFLP